MAKRTSVKSLIRDLEPNELREVILELCKLSPKNKQFLKLYLQSSDQANPEAVVEEAKKHIYVGFHGRSRFPKLDLRAARKAVSEYTKVLKEYPLQAAELKLYYVEVGTGITDEFGDMYEGFYNSLGSMFASFCKDVRDHPAWHSHFQGRIEALLLTTSYMGWGYGDEIAELASELEESIVGEEEADA